MKNIIKSKARFYECLGQICEEVLYRISVCESDMERIREKDNDEDDGGYYAEQLEIVTEKKSHYETILSKLEKL